MIYDRDLLIVEIPFQIRMQSTSRDGFLNAFLEEQSERATHCHW